VYDVHERRVVRVAGVCRATLLGLHLALIRRRVPGGLRFWWLGIHADHDALPCT
jgi:hypothetical protein